MKELVPYLMFNGRCREAVEFYTEVLAGKLYMTTFGESGQGDPADAERIMHAKVAAKGATLMASDMPAKTAGPAGSSITLSVDCESAEEQDRLFAALSEGGTVEMPLQDTFWGARFGMLKDRFGMDWMFNFDLPKEQG